MKQKNFLLTIGLVIVVFISLSFNVYSQETNTQKIKQEISEKGIKQFIKELDKSPPTNKVENIKLLGELKDPKLVKPIINKFLKDKSENEQVRSAAAYALGEINDKSALKPLVKSLDTDRSAFVRLHAALALGKLGSSYREARYAIYNFKGLKTDHLSDDWTFLKDYKPDLNAIESFHKELVNIGDPAVEPLYSLMSVRQINESSIVSILGDIESPKAINFLIFELIKSEYDLLWCIEKVLLEIGEPAAKPLIEILINRDSFLSDSDFENFDKPESPELSEKFQEIIRKLLKELDYQPESPEELTNYLIAVQEWDELIEMGNLAVESLIKVIDYKDPNLRLRTVMALGKIKNPKAVEPLINVLKSDNYYEVRKQAAKALGIIKDPRATKPLIMAAQEDMLKNTWAIDALLEMQVIDTEAIELYVRSLNLDNDDQKLKAANIIVNSNDPKAVNARPQALQVIASLTYITEIVSYDKYGRGASIVLKNTEGQEVAKKEFWYNPNNPTQKSGEGITDLIKGNIIHSDVYDEYGKPKNPMWLCLDKEGNIIRKSGKAVLVKTFDALQKSKSKIVKNIRGFKDKKITKIYPCKNCAENTGIKNCNYVW